MWEWIKETIINPAWHDYSYLEQVSTFFAILSVWFARKENIWVFPTGLIGVGLAAFIVAQFALYGDMGINAYYFVMSIYGWYMWTRVKEEKQLPISWNSLNEQLIAAGATVLIFLLFAFILGKTDSTTVFWDALTTGLAVVAMYLMAKKKVENWIYWIAVNALSIPLYYHKGLIYYSLQYIIFLALAIDGYFLWKKSYNKSRNELS